MAVRLLCCVRQENVITASRYLNFISPAVSLSAYHHTPCSISNSRKQQVPYKKTNEHVFLKPISGVKRVRQYQFHTSSRHHANPLLWLFVKPIAKAVSIISGRYLRKQWNKLPDSDKKACKSTLMEHKGKLIAAGLLVIAAAFIDYFTHIQEAPMTKRKRYIAFTPEQFLKIIQVEYQMHIENYEDAIVTPQHPVYGLVTRIVQKIVDSNQDETFFQQQSWTVIVVDNPESNAFVLPSGQIFVFSGLLKMTENEDQLAVVLGHEMAHALLSHGAEKVSFGQILDKMVILVMAGIWFFMPSDGIAIVTQWFYNKVIQACYDVRQSSCFWNKMAVKYAIENGNESEMPEFLSTHPASTNRAKSLDDRIPQAIDTRKLCKCPELPKKDPRDQIKLLLEMIAQAAQSEEKSGSGSAPTAPVIAAAATS